MTIVSQEHHQPIPACRVAGCGGLARWLIENDEGRQLQVCEKCRDHMLALYGWALAPRMTV